MGCPVERVAGILEVSRTEDGQQIVIRRTGSRLNVCFPENVVLSPRQARHLASLLIIHAEDAEKVVLGQENNLYSLSPRGKST